MSALVVEKDKKSHGHIQWDEQTIAEHDKERGTRQRIDEAPTPFRYNSGSESEYESSGESDSGFRSRDSQNTPTSQSNSHSTSNKTSNTNYESDSSAKRVRIAEQNSSVNMIQDSWEIINAKLEYEKQLQDLNNNSTGELVANKDEQAGESYNYGREDNVAYGTDITEENFEKALGVDSVENIDLGEDPMALENAQKNSLHIGKTIFVKADPHIVDPELGKSADEKDSKSGSPVHDATFNNTLLNSHDYHDVNNININNNVNINNKNPNLVATSIANSNSIGSSNSVDNSSTDGSVKKQFQRKRASHYNEFKVLQAMRNKMRHTGEYEKEAEEDDGY